MSTESVPVVTSVTRRGSVVWITGTLDGAGWKVRIEPVTPAPPKTVED